MDNTLTHFGGFLRKKQYDSTGKDEESNEEVCPCYDSVVF